MALRIFDVALKKFRFGARNIGLHKLINIAKDLGTTKSGVALSIFGVAPKEN